MSSRNILPSLPPCGGCGVCDACRAWLPERPAVAAYVLLEQAVLRLQGPEGDEKLIDHVLEAMDPIWLALTDEERERLKRRS